MTENLLHDPDVYTELNQHRGGCVPSVVHAGISDAGHSEEVFPVVPVLAWVDRSSIWPTEHEVMVLPLGSGREPLSILGNSV
ncbi:hypothetical protein BJY22_001706 [Kribbella shirazensis]|uniref:Uncharacterized protein n=1 Tax=Kribbella shirazensis TaxID=1105143 RepID=A0A7X5V7D3_9ACTN|nr:hypothetical protein [Kribbella shirazensis]NIK55989.1 hypothetical protein [Kribbella shirazensis]